MNKRTWTACTALLITACGTETASTHSDTMASNATADAAATADASGDTGQAAPVATCTYTNPFSQGTECKAYTGTGWTAEASTTDCAAPMAATSGAYAASGTCSFASVLGSCAVDKGDGKGYTLVSGGSDSSQCDLAKLGCETFAKGVFTPGGPCGGNSGGTGGGGGGGSAPLKPVYGTTPFVQPYLDCRPPLAGEPAGKGPDGKVCTQVLISGATEAGRHYEDYASCQDVLTNRPYWPAKPAKVTAKDDPRLKDTAYMAEVAWARQQLEATACVCCHTQKIAPDGKASNWYLDAEGIWLDGLKDSGLAMMAGLADSTTLGAFAAKDNNGFDRTALGAPTTDVERMRKLLLGEWARRGLQPEDGKKYPPFGGPLVDQLQFKAEPCTEGEGIDAGGVITWQGGEARYVYVLEASANAPGVPPNLDRPVGTLWLADVPSTAEPMQTGIAYGKVSGAQRQRLPESGPAPALQAGKTYHLHVLRDIGFPITRCLFTAK
jgi:hypothetical protein